MSTQRYISTSFWDDEWIQTLDPSEKLLYLYYMTNPLTNIAGVYKITLRRVCFDTGYNENTVKHIMDKFQKAKKAIKYGEYIILPSWPNHQKWQKAPRIKDGIIAILKNLPDDVLSKLVENGYKFDLKIVSDTVYIPYTNPSNYIDLDTDIDIDTDIKEKPTKDIKHKYGEYQHVLLTDSQMISVVEKLGEHKTKYMIKVMDEAIEEKGNIWHISNFAMALLKWAKKDTSYKPPQQTTPSMPRLPRPPKCPTCGKPTIEYMYGGAGCKPCGIMFRYNDKWIREK